MMLVLEKVGKHEKMFNFLLYHIADQQSCVSFKFIWQSTFVSPSLPGDMYQILREHTPQPEEAATADSAVGPFPEAEAGAGE
jgi:hypothetical protein